MTVTENAGGDVGRRTPLHLWIIGVVALLWTAMGAFDYLATQLQLDFYMSQFSEQQLEYFYGYPAWAVAGWAFGVWGAFAGAVGLLLRKKWSVWAFGVSLAGMFISTVYSFALSNGAEMFGPEGTVFSAVIWLVGIFLLVYTLALAKRGVLV